MPPPAFHITLPEKPVFILTVDTEEEWDWANGFPKPPFSTHNIEEIPAFQAFCSELGVAPTYFVDHAVASNHEHALILKEHLDKGECDIGAHLHPWATPPLKETVNEFNSHAINLPLALFDRKISELTSKLTSVFGQHPYSYRSGRWGINAEHLGILQQHGYRVDSSVRPFYRDKNFSYASAPTGPYWPDSKNVLVSSKETSGVLEVPITSGYSHANFELLNRIHSSLSVAPWNRLRLVGALRHIGLIRQVTVTPEDTNAADVCQCIDASIKRGDRIITMFIHSSDLLPGCTPYVQTVADKVRFLKMIAHCVHHLRNKHDASMTTMRDIRKQLTGTP